MCVCPPLGCGHKNIHLCACAVHVCVTGFPFLDMIHSPPLLTPSPHPLSSPPLLTPLPLLTPSPHPLSSPPLLTPLLSPLLPLHLPRTTLQSLYQATENARQNNYYVGGLSHTWMTFYQSPTYRWLPHQKRMVKAPTHYIYTPKQD